ncbi:hypothetical protein JKP88DRAFT_243913 [Tribonema minus]|uniref:Uncharacterized protein n=1 Tax=Tribonema minus TaxID=303371 RepID=A0A836CL66_9STRA|nr:hypothetical protein JKP88DRAFT_243913 [Tribonema minus]
MAAFGEAAQFGYVELGPAPLLPAPYEGMELGPLPAAPDGALAAAEPLLYADLAPHPAPDGAAPRRRGRPKKAETIAREAENARRAAQGLPLMERPSARNNGGMKRRKKSASWTVKIPVTTYLEGAIIRPGDTAAAVAETTNLTTSTHAEQQLNQVTYKEVIPATLESHAFMNPNTPELMLVRQYQTMIVDLSYGAPPRYSSSIMCKEWQRVNEVNTTMHMAAKCENHLGPIPDMTDDEMMKELFDLNLHGDTTTPARTMPV